MKHSAKSTSTKSIKKTPMKKASKKATTLTPAQKAWQTRKANAAKKAAVKLSAAQKAWVTRKLNAAQKAVKAVAKKLTPKKKAPVVAPPSKVNKSWDQLAKEILGSQALNATTVVPAPAPVVPATPPAPYRPINTTVPTAVRPSGCGGYGVPLAPPPAAPKSSKIVVGIVKDAGGTPTFNERQGDYSQSGTMTARAGSYNQGPLPTPAPVKQTFRTIAELYDNNREKWAQGSDAVDKNGNTVDVLSDRAVAFDLLSAALRVYDNIDDREEALEKLSEAILKWDIDNDLDVADLDPEDVVYEFNDADSTTFTDVRRVLALAGV